MFTGIVEQTGVVADVERGSDGAVIWIESELLRDCELGASVAVDGTCMTVTKLQGNRARFDASAETLARTTLARRSAGDRVNLERPLRAGQELGGHMVQGHVDGVGRVESVEPDGEGLRMQISLPAGLDRYVVEKGSVTIDGVSLTVADVNGSRFGVALIPHTLSITTLGEYRSGREVNIEIDVLAKYVERALAAHGPRTTE